MVALRGGACCNAPFFQAAGGSSPDLDAGRSLDPAALQPVRAAAHAHPQQTIRRQMPGDPIWRFGKTWFR